jgi:hypothetical protein
MFLSVGIGIGIAFGIEVAIDRYFDSDTDSDPGISRYQAFFREGIRYAVTWFFPSG